MSSQRQQIRKFQAQLLTKYREFDAVPEKALAKINCADQWEIDQHFAVTALYKNLAEGVAIGLFSGFVRKWESYYLEKPVVMGSTKQRSYWENKNPNKWLRARIKMVKKHADKFPVVLPRLKNDGVRTLEAQSWALKCIELARECSLDGLTVEDTAKEIQLLADKWGFKPQLPTQQDEPFEGESDADYNFRINEDNAWFHIERLIDESWWKRRIEKSYRQFCEHCQIIAGRVRKNASEYLSMAGRADYKERQDANVLALSKMVARNVETGEEVPALEIIKKSTGNPAIRRCELMVRCAGFEIIAKEFNLIGGFFTFTTPSRFHPCTSSKDKRRAFDNDKYRGATPKQAQAYLSKIWSQARAKLKRMNLHIFGFRVCEPHHDATPHWHALFFFKPEHEQAIRAVLADYFTREDRAELHVDREDFKEWNKSIKTGFSTSDMFNPDRADERRHIFSVAKRIRRRFDYKRINPKKGSATGYIAKYIAKNIDGYQLSDDQDTGTTADEKARAVQGWASTWNVRQFQQIGGASVTVWRELRRMKQTDDEVAEMKAKKAAKENGTEYIPAGKVKSFYDLQKENDSIELARISANAGNWSMYIHAMGGIFCERKDHPIKISYKDAKSRYGEAVKKVEGLTNGLKTALTRTEEWEFTQKSAEDAGFKTGASRPWSSDTNCTVSVNEDEKQEVSNLLEEKGEEVSDRIINDLFTFQDTVLDEQWRGDVKRTIWGKLKRNMLNIGGNFRLRTWEVNVKRNVTYIEPPKQRFKNDVTGRRNAFLDVKPLTDEYLTLRDERQSALHPLTWDMYEENVTKNGKYIAPVKSNIESMTEAVEKGAMSGNAFNSYLDFHKRYEGFHYRYIYSLFKEGSLPESGFIKYMDEMLNFNEEYGAFAQGHWRLGCFSEFTKQLEPLTDEYEKRVNFWGQELTPKKEREESKID